MTSIATPSESGTSLSPGITSFTTPSEDNDATTTHHSYPFVTTERSESEDEMLDVGCRITPPGKHHGSAGNGCSIVDIPFSGKGSPEHQF